jgi:nitroreductase
MSHTRNLFSFLCRGIRWLKRHMEIASCSFGARSTLWSRIHYVVFNSAFGREQKAFLAGKFSYYASLQAPAGTIALLRRNVHRLEKGLLMRPRRVPFALDYIAETVSAYVAAVNSQRLDSEEMTWASDVLTAYFIAHKDQAQLTEAADDFHASVNKEFCSAVAPRIPYLRDLDASPVTYEALASLAKRRRSVRWFLQKPVERELIDKALELGAQAPSACNRQPFEFRIFDNKDMVQKVISLPYGLAGYGHQVPVVAVVIGQQRHFFDERDRHLIYIDASLAVMGFLLALETLGLSACCVNWPDIESQERAMASLLKLSADERPVMCLAIGYPDPDGMVAASTKKSLSQLRRYNFE